LDDIIAPMSSVEGLGVEGRDALEAVVQSLMRDPAFDPESPEGAQITFFPDLVWIELASISFTQSNYGRFQELLRRRAAQDPWSTLEDVTFVDCEGLDEKELDELRTSVKVCTHQTNLGETATQCKCCNDVECPGCESDVEDVDV
jgi:hypothetical protein